MVKILRKAIPESKGGALCIDFLFQNYQVHSYEETLNLRGAMAPYFHHLCHQIYIPQKLPCIYDGTVVDIIIAFGY